MKNLIVIALLSLLSSFFGLTEAQAAAPDIEWLKILDGSGYDTIYSIQQTGEGGYILAGCTYSGDGDVNDNHGGSDALIIKLDKSGELVWQKCLGGSGDDVAYSVHETIDGGCIFAGSTSSDDGDVSGNHGDFDAWIVKLNVSGGIEWQKCLGGLGNESANSICETQDRGYIIAGSTSSNDGDVSGNHGDIDAWIVKLNAAGELEWQKCFGGSGADTAATIQQTRDGGYIFSGSLYSDGIVPDISYSGSWIVKLDARGAVEWQECLDKAGLLNTQSIQQTKDGGYIIAGHSSSAFKNESVKEKMTDFTVPPLYSTAWVVKLNVRGVVEWQKSFGSSIWDFAFSIRQTRNGSYILAGANVSMDSSNGWIVMLDASGEIEWEKILDVVPNYIWQTSDGGYITIGGVSSDNRTRIWIAKLASDGIDSSGSGSSGCNVAAGFFFLVFSILPLLIKPIRNDDHRLLS